jgi:hypothetical protein
MPVGAPSEALRRCRCATLSDAVDLPPLLALLLLLLLPLEGPVSRCQCSVCTHLVGAARRGVHMGVLLRRHPHSSPCGRMRARGCTRARSTSVLLSSACVIYTFGARWHTGGGHAWRLQIGTELSGPVW